MVRNIMSFKDNYINSNLTFTKDKIFESSSNSEVMGNWEKPMMEKYAKITNHNNGDILEIGFGLGLAASKFLSMGLNSYTIVEIHPQIIEKLKIWASDKKNVTIIEGDWMDNLDSINSKKYDGIFFDTHMDDNRPKFRELVVDESIKEDGVFSWFNGCPDPLHPDFDIFGYGDDVLFSKIVLNPEIGYMEKYEMYITWYEY